ncbi:MAG TPA: M1 family metallopeptidase [Polyangiaceae bacterium]|nr:M1 family metallopeptidase [Polyangiaceae bacterium]
MTRTMREVRGAWGPRARAACRRGAPWAALWAALALLWAPRAALAEAPAPPRFDAAGRAVGEPLSERVVAYEIDATLDAKAGTLKGREALTWTNKSQAPQSTLWFHLYWNAFKNERSTFYRDSKLLGFRDESASAEDYPDRKDDEWGYSDVTAIGVRGGVDLKPSLRFRHPDDDNEHDQTVFTVELPAPVAPGASVTLEIAWEAKVPKIVARAGRKGDYYFFGQWFPKIGVLEVPPTRGAAEPRWNCHQYHSNTEYYADFGTYDVKMTVPKEYVLGASGVRIGRVENPDGTATYHHHQDDVHDFAWTAWPGFVERSEVFRAPGLPEVQVTVLAPAGHDRGARQSFEAIKASLERYGRWWYPWPYPHLTIVAPPRGASASGGMEYPTLITTGATADPVEPKDYALWSVTAHEFGHNYWYGLLASNEFEESWLDEGINSYGTQKLLDAEGVTLRPFEWLAPSGLRPLLAGAAPIELTETELARLRTKPQWDSPVITPGWKYRGWADYGTASYLRPQMNLLVLEKLLGGPTMGEVMRAYVERYRFKHPRSEDFFAVASEVSGQDLTWYFDQAFRSTAGLDVKVADVACAGATAEYDVGAFDDGKGGKVVKSRASERERQKKAEAAGEKPTRRCRVTLEKEGAMAVPVAVRVTFEDGTQKAETWDAKGGFKHYFYVGQGRGADVARVEIEPEGRLVFDAGRANDSYTKEADGRVAARVFGWLTYAAQLVLGFLPSLT